MKFKNAFLIGSVIGVLVIGAFFIGRVTYPEKECPEVKIRQIEVQGTDDVLDERLEQGDLRFTIDYEKSPPRIVLKRFREPGIQGFFVLPKWLHIDSFDSIAAARKAAELIAMDTIKMRRLAEIDKEKNELVDEMWSTIRSEG